MKTQVMVPTEHEKSEWSRLAQHAYASDRNDIGHTFSTAAAFTRKGESLPLSRFDALQTVYRAWLVFGWNDAETQFDRHFATISTATPATR